MKNWIGNIWQYPVKNAIIVITTNGFVKRNGDCVMGKGIALTARQRFPYIPRLLGKYIKIHGNRPFNLGNNLVSFPVKPCGEAYANDQMIVPHMQGKFNIGDFVPGWAMVADLDLIAASAKLLVQMADKFNWDLVLLPRPGCGNGNLSWAKVKPILSEILDNRFIACTFKY